MKTINGRSYPTYDEIKDAQRQLAADSNCTRDHCTPEERAVIEAVVTDREAVLNSSGSNEDIDKFFRTRQRLIEAADALLAARAGKEAG